MICDACGSAAVRCASACSGDRITPDAPRLVRWSHQSQCSTTRQLGEAPAWFVDTAKVRRGREPALGLSPRRWFKAAARRGQGVRDEVSRDDGTQSASLQREHPLHHRHAQSGVHRSGETDSDSSLCGRCFSAVMRRPACACAHRVCSGGGGRTAAHRAQAAEHSRRGRCWTPRVQSTALTTQAQRHKHNGPEMSVQCGSMRCAAALRCVGLTREPARVEWSRCAVLSAVWFAWPSCMWCRSCAPPSLCAPCVRVDAQTCGGAAFARGAAHSRHDDTQRDARTQAHTHEREHWETTTTTHTDAQRDAEERHEGRTHRRGAGGEQKDQRAAAAEADSAGADAHAAGTVGTHTPRPKQRASAVTRGGLEPCCCCVRRGARRCLRCVPALPRIAFAERVHSMPRSCRAVFGPFLRAAVLCACVL